MRSSIIHQEKTNMVMGQWLSWKCFTAFSLVDFLSRMHVSDFTFIV